MVKDNREFCPKCQTNLQGEPIAEDRQEEYGFCTHFSRKISVYNVDLDRTTHHMCPDCGWRWDKLPSRMLVN